MSSLIPWKISVIRIVYTPGSTPDFSGCICCFPTTLVLPWTTANVWQAADSNHQITVTPSIPSNPLQVGGPTSMCLCAVSFLGSACPGYSPPIQSVCASSDISIGWQGDGNLCCGGHPELIPSYGVHVTPSPDITSPPVWPAPYCSCECDGFPKLDSSLFCNYGAPVPPFPPSATSFPIQYSTGMMKLTDTDIVATGFGTPWGHSRTFNSRLGINYNSGNGCNWLNEGLPFLTEAQANGKTHVVVMGGPNGGHWFLESPVMFTRWSSIDLNRYNWTVPQASIVGIRRMATSQSLITEPVNSSVVTLVEAKNLK